VLALLVVSPATAQGPISFRDATEAAGLDFRHFNGMVGELYFSEMMGSGVALVDYDRDGDLDLYLVQGAMLGPDQPLEAALAPPHGEPVDRLYRNDQAPGPNGAPRLTLVDVTGAAGLREGGYGMGVAVGDVDNDGWPDLYVTNLGPNALLRNRGDGTFEDVTTAAGVGDDGWGVPATFLDVDGDGWLDLFVGNYVDYGLALDKKCVSGTGARDYCGPLAYEPSPDVLYRNRGDGSFEVVSGRAGVDQQPAGALGAVAFDADGDGWLDLYVANDQVPNKLWLNQKDGSFADEALLAGAGVNEAGLPEASMGLVAADLDGDGDEDLFMTHLTRETNTLYRNDGTGLFEDVTRTSGLDLPSWKATGFGVGLADFDRDGHLDVFVANGAVKRIEELTDRGDPYPLAQANQVYRGLGDGRWAEVTETAGPALGVQEVSRGVSRGDVDLDGDEDLVVSNNNGPARLLLDDSSPQGDWLAALTLVSPAGRVAMGTSLWLERGDGRGSLRRVGTDGSYASALSPEVLFGLGPAPPALVLRADWLGGGSTVWREVPAGRRLVLVRGGGEGETP
jgi:hypothetical protein